MPVRAVIFDFGGVILTSPFEAFARYEADIDWQWAHSDDDDPAVTASALARLIRDSREVVGRAEALLVAALADSAP